MISTTDTRKLIDSEGRAWNVRFTLATARRIDNSDFAQKKGTDFSFLSMDEEAVRMLMADHGFLMFCLFVAVYDQIETKLGISPQENPDEAADKFFDCFGGDTIGAARKVTLEAISDFFRGLNPAISILIDSLLEQMPRLEEFVKKVGPEKMDKLMTRHLDEMSKLLDDDKLFGELSSSVSLNRD